MIRLLDLIVDMGARVNAQHVRSDEEAELFELAGDLLSGPIHDALFTWVNGHHDRWLKWRAELDAAASKKLAAAVA